MTTAQVSKKQDAIESVHLSADEKALMVSLVHLDSEVVAFAKAGGLGAEPADAVEAAKRIFKIGILSVATGAAQATVSELHRVVAQIDALSAMPEQVANRLGETVGKELDRMVGDDERPGALSAALEIVTSEAAKSLTKAVKPIQDALLGSGPTALPQVLEVRVLDALTRGTREALDRLFDVEGGSPLMTHLANGEKAIAALREENVAIEGRLRAEIVQLAEKVVTQQAQKPTPVEAGNTWESDSLDDIARVTAILGDTVEPVGNSAGHGRNKAGDHLLHVCDPDLEGIRVAVECRTGASRALTVAQLREMVENREAHAGLLLAPTPEALPRDARVAGFRVYLAERVVVLCYDRMDPAAEQLLVTAVQVVRLLARLAATSGGSLDECEQIRDGITRIETALGHLKPLRAAVTGIEKETGVVRKHASELETEIRRVIIDLTASLQNVGRAH
jgi:hypothetical protein